MAIPVDKFELLNNRSERQRLLTCTMIVIINVVIKTIISTLKLKSGISSFLNTCYTCYANKLSSETNNDQIFLCRKH